MPVDSSASQLALLSRRTWRVPPAPLTTVCPCLTFTPYSAALQPSPQDWHTLPSDPSCSSWGQYDVNTTLFPDMTRFGREVHANGSVIGNPLKLSFNLHGQSGVDHCAERYPEMVDGEWERGHPNDDVSIESRGPSA
jgi:hypothetical protein